MEDWLAALFGVVGIIGFALMMAPQALLNGRTMSTEGMSLSMVVLWHLAGILCGAYYLAQYLGTSPGFAQSAASSGQASALWMVVSVAFMVLLCCIIEAQVVAYGRLAPEAKGIARGFCSSKAMLSLLLTLAVSTVAIWALGEWMRIASMDTTYWVGNMLASVLLGCGFLPQIWIFVSTRSIEGYSFGVTFFDIMGSAGNTAVTLAPSGTTIPQALVQAAPFLTIIGMHVLLISAAVVITCCIPKAKLPAHGSQKDFVDENRTDAS